MTEQEFYSAIEHGLGRAITFLRNERLSEEDQHKYYKLVYRYIFSEKQNKRSSGQYELDLIESFANSDSHKKSYTQSILFSVSRGQHESAATLIPLIDKRASVNVTAEILYSTAYAGILEYLKKFANRKDFPSPHCISLFFFAARVLVKCNPNDRKLIRRTVSDVAKLFAYDNKECNKLFLQEIHRLLSEIRRIEPSLYDRLIVEAIKEHPYADCLNELAVNVKNTAPEPPALSAEELIKLTYKSFADAKKSFFKASKDTLVSLAETLKSTDDNVLHDSILHLFASTRPTDIYPYSHHAGCFYEPKTELGQIFPTDPTFLIDAIGEDVINDTPNELFTLLQALGGVKHPKVRSLMLRILNNPKSDL